MRILELFSGYGTASFGLKRLGIPYELIGYSDIDKYANQCFQQNHGGKELGDVKNINPNDLEDFDLLTGGFPCQSFSIAGKGLGELDTRGTLFNEIIRIAEIKKPRYMLLENVKGLTNKNHKATFEKILSELDRVGYLVHWKVLNSREHGIPQNRERVWFVCFRDFIEFKRFKFPEKEELKIFIKDILEEEVEEKYYLSDKAVERLAGRNNMEKKDGTIGAILSTNYKCNWNTPLVLDLYNHKIKDEGVCITLTEPHHNNLRIAEPTIEKDYRIRKLNPKECFRLMGFLNDEINLEGLSDTQKYKLAGNGQDVNVVTKIFERMFASHKETKTK